MKRKRDRKLETQRRFVFREVARIDPVTRSMIYDAVHVLPQLESIINYLKNFDPATEPPHCGAVFWGPNRTGKNYIARYVATETRTRLVDIRGFPVETKDGEQIWQPQDIRNLFALSGEWVKKHRRPIILLIDQIDDWLDKNWRIRDELEVRLDGFAQRRSGVFLIVTAKNKPVVKPTEKSGDKTGEFGGVEEFFGGSLFKSGRIGFHIAFSLPDRKQQAVLLKGFLSDCSCDDQNIDVENVVYLLDDPAPGSIRSMVLEAREVEKARDGLKSPISQDVLIEVFLRYLLDPPTGHEQSEEEKTRIRIHELGHYIVLRAWGLPARLVCARPGLKSLGTTFIMDDYSNSTIESLRRFVTGIYGSIEAEKLLGFKPNNGTESDLRTINGFAKQILNFEKSRNLQKYGDLKIDTGGDEFYSEELLARYELALGQIMKRERQRARLTLMFFGASALKKIAARLAGKPHEVLLQRELDALLEPKLSEFHRKHKIKDRIKK